MNRRKRNVAMALGLLLLVTALGCAGGETPTPPPAGDKPDKDKLAPPSGGGGEGGPSKPSPPPQSEGGPTSMSKIELLKDWKYNPDTKWDPFVIPPPRKVEGKEKFDLDQMILYGIVWGSGYDRAYIRLPDGTDKIVKKGDILGKHNGEVKQILSDRIVVEEKYYNPERPEEIFIIQKNLLLVKLQKQ